MLGCGVTALAGPFDRASVRTAVTRSGLTTLAAPPGAAEVEGPLDPLAVLPLAEAAYGRLAVGGRADFAVFAEYVAPADFADFADFAAPAIDAAVGEAAVVEPAEGEAVVVEPVAGGAAVVGTVVVRPGSCLATVLAGRLVYRRR
ncbi:hypothetical protein ACFQ0M_27910 [Kitasatospora aburaviensis]